MHFIFLSISIVHSHALKDIFDTSSFCFSADATLDKLLLEFALPNLNHVIAIEPDSEFNKQIDEAFTGFQNRQIKVCKFHMRKLVYCSLICDYFIFPELRDWRNNVWQVYRDTCHAYLNSIQTVLSECIFNLRLKISRAL